MPFPATFHPVVRAWFERTFGSPTDAQSLGWASIVRGVDTLIAAPTGSGKTLAAFLSSLDALTHRALAGELEGGVDVLYVSPLKALSSDVQKNLAVPLEGIRRVASELGLEPPAIRTALRTGDTTASARTAITKTPPHVLITTPESLYLLLTAERSREVLRRVKTVVVDEVHALMRDKRGSHLALSLARLDALADTRPQRIGLSATVHPIERAARFLVGTGRPCEIIDVGHRRAIDIGIEVPRSELGAVATNEQWGEVYDRLAELIAENRTTLVFVNTRRMAERVAHHLAERVGEHRVGAHHGSLAKERRLRIEERLKSGEMKAIVATASLELGIDVGSVDLVCQIGSPRAMTTFLQRIGRSGHALGRTSVGRLFATSRDELCECAALVRGVAAGKLDQIEPPEAPLDVLAQQIVAECAAREIGEDALFALVREAEPFGRLERSAFDEIVTMVSEGAAPRLGRGGALVHRDRIHGVLRGRRAARIVALTNGGAIPDVADYRVVLDPDETFVGTVNEDWAIESMAGDVFVLGSHSWRIRRVESRQGVVRVEDAAGAPPSVPFWLGEAPSRSWELSMELTRLRIELVVEIDRASGSAVEWLGRECGLAEAAAVQLVDYVRAQRDALGIVPTMNDVVYERFFDEAGGMQLVVHAPFGGRVNRAFGLALRKRFCATFDFELQAAATDDAIVLSIGTSQSFPLTDAFALVRSGSLERTLEQAILVAPMFGARWRWNATRALAVLRQDRGKKVQPFLQRMRADDLMAAVFPAQVACQENVTGPIEVPDHPLLRQTVADCLYEAMDLVRLRGVIEGIERGEIRAHARDTTEPSPFSHEVLNAKPYAFLDDAPLEERRARAVSLRRTLPADQKDLGALDPEAIARVVSDASPAPRSADELHDALLGLVSTRIEPAWRDWLAALVGAGRARTITVSGVELAYAAENQALVSGLYPRATDDEAVVALVRGHAEVAGPFTLRGFAERLLITEADLAIAAARLEGEGLLLRGDFSRGSTNNGELCDRRLLARIHRMTLDRLRREIEPVSAQDFMRYLFERHHLSPDARSGGRAGLREALGMLQGFELSASSWESAVLARRVAGYKPEWLDELCLSGEAAWLRLSERRASGTTSRATPIALVERKSLGWMLAAVRSVVTPVFGSATVDDADGAPRNHSTAVTLEAMKQRGALFFHDLVELTGLGRDELTEALWELVGAGAVTGDGFQPLRDLLRSPRPSKQRSFQGRWSLVELDPSSRIAWERADLADRVSVQLLARYGVVSPRPGRA